MLDDDRVPSMSGGATSWPKPAFVLLASAALAGVVTAASAGALPAAARPHHGEPRYGLSGRVGDLYLGAMVKLRLFVDMRTTAAEIDVDAERAVVTLRGEVPGEEAKLAAEANAAVVRGVDVVRNRLQVAEPPGRAGAAVGRAAVPGGRPRG